MPMMFDNLEAAVVWLHTHGWRQNDAGEWLKGKRRANIRRSPVNDGVVAVSLVKTP